MVVKLWAVEVWSEDRKSGEIMLRQLAMCTILKSCMSVCRDSYGKCYIVSVITKNIYAGPILGVSDQDHKS